MVTTVLLGRYHRESVLFPVIIQFMRDKILASGVGGLESTCRPDGGPVGFLFVVLKKGVGVVPGDQEVTRGCAINPWRLRGACLSGGRACVLLARRRRGGVAS